MPTSATPAIRLGTAVPLPCALKLNTYLRSVSALLNSQSTSSGIVGWLSDAVSPHAAAMARARSGASLAPIVFEPWMRSVRLGRHTRGSNRSGPVTSGVTGGVTGDDDAAADRSDTMARSGMLV